MSIIGHVSIYNLCQRNYFCCKVEHFGYIFQSWCSMIHCLIKIENWEVDHNSLECRQNRPTSCTGIDCVNTSCLIHRADYKPLTGILKMPLMCQKPTTVQFL